MNAKQNAWHPGPDYEPREGDYAKLAGEFQEHELVELVQARAKEDGNWVIEQGLAKGKETKMRQMMAWVGNPQNIVQCYKANDDGTKTVDWICRELATATHLIFKGFADD